MKKVLKHWQGLGYNRRALYLHHTAKIVTEQYSGKLPREEKILRSFPGIGAYTAAAIPVFAFDLPNIFIETNIRTVFIHTFFPAKKSIKDNEILPLVEQTLDRDEPRTWYYALMDYGAKLKKELPNPNRKSAHYAKQSKFEGSDRQLRGQIVRLLVAKSPLPTNDLFIRIDADKKRLSKIIDDLQREGFIVQRKKKLRLT